MTVVPEHFAPASPTSPAPGRPFAPPVDPFAPRVGGWYVDGSVAVARLGVGRLPAAAASATPIAITRTFELRRSDRLYVLHRLFDREIHDGLTERIRTELVEPGWISGEDLFERLFVGTVLSMRDSALDAWTLFYGNQRRVLGEFMEPRPVRSSGSGDIDGIDDIGDDVAQFARIYAHADARVPATGSVLELGSCFGFLALHLAARPGRRVTASDLCAPAMRLLSRMTADLGIPLEARVLDARRIAVPDHAFDTVVLVHLLEHLDEREGLRALDEATRVARSRVVVAVPYEDEPSAMYGHVRALSRPDLETWAGVYARTWSSSIEDIDGGWLVLDRRVPGAHDHRGKSSLPLV